MASLFRILTSWFLGAFTRLFSLLASNVLATKIIMTALFVTFLPIVLNNFIYSLMSTIMQQAVSHTSGMGAEINPVIAFADLGGYFASELGFVSAISIIISAMFVRFTLSWIPFVGPK